MTDPALTGFAPEDPAGASDLRGEEPPAYTLARLQIPRHGYHRDEVVTINLNDPQVKYELECGWLVPLDQVDQPRIGYDPVTMQPILIEEAT